MTPLVVVVVAALLAAGVYLGLERLGATAWLPAGLRFVAWLVLGLLLFDVSCARSPESVRPIVLLDASLSMGAVPERWSQARAEAARLGEVRFVGAVGADSLPIGGRSLLAGAVAAATAAGRPVWIVSDGEIEDGTEMAPDLLAQTGVRLVPRERRPDLAITRVAGPERIAAGDTLRLEVEITGFDTGDRRQVTVDVSSGGTRWFSTPVALEGGSGSTIIEGTAPAAGATGPHLLEVALRSANDGEPRTDLRLHAVRVLPTPGVVVVASPASWETRFFYRALAEVSALPVRGYFALDGNRWSRMGEVTPVPTSQVEQAVLNADLLIRFGDLPERLRRTEARGRWDWIATSRAAAPAEGDWYLVPGGVSPIAGAFIGLPVDSFPPAVALAALTPGPKDWVGLSAQLNRRGGERPAVIGRDSAGKREVLVGLNGLWRWAFRGGASEQAYRAWVAATTTWLLGATDSLTGRAKPVRAVVQQGRPLVFERLRPDVSALRIDLRGAGGALTDTLRFDGAGRAELELPPGRYDYRLEGGGSGVLGVEVYSDEWLPRTVVLEDRAATVSVAALRDPLRDKWWLFALAIVALSGEWWWRRRAGLR